MKLSRFTLFRNTPFLDMQNTILFSSNAERDKYFDNYGNYDKMVFTQGFNFWNGRGTFKVQKTRQELMGFNYMRFYDAIDGLYYYAFILDTVYINDGMTEVHFMPDFIMTYCQGNKLQQYARHVEVERRHLTKREYEENLLFLKSNGDDLVFNTKEYIFHKQNPLGNNGVLIHSTVNLESDFGTSKEPKMKTSKGGTVDYITSPVDLYLCKTETEFDNVMNYLTSFPWIAQNIQKCILIPSTFFPKELTKVKMNNGQGTDIYRLKKEKFAVSDTFNKGLDMSHTDLLKVLGLRHETEHLLRDSLFSIELTDLKGQILTIDPKYIKDGLAFYYYSIFGYNNQIKVAVKDYTLYNKKGKEGQNLNHTLNISDFDEVPILINSGDLAQAKSAYSRGLQQSKTLSGRVDKIMNGNLQDKLMNSLSFFTGGLSASGLSNLFTNEYETQRELQAQKAEQALNSPIVTNQVSTNALLNKYGIFGIHLFISKVSPRDFENALKYYNKYGFKLDKLDSDLGDIRSQEKCNYFKFKGNWSIPNVDVQAMNVIRTLFESGVCMWHYNAGKYGRNPISNYITSNEWREY